jgi:hypothetical protein
MDDKPKIYYLAPDSNTPSWGLGIIYHHVLALNEAGFNAFLVHEKSPFKVDWLDAKVPVLYWNHSIKINPDDIVVVPEVKVNLKELKKLKCRKILFVQASSFLFEMLPDDETHLSLGFESAIGIMPHMMPIIEQFTGLKAQMIRPFIAPYFRKEKSKLHEREKIILIFPKFNQQDFGIVRRVINDRLQKINPKGLKGIFKSKWKLVVLKGKTHKEVAKLMQEATFFIATNTFESFNASCVEAMSAGCLSICYEGFGPRDYMVNGKNAFVFPNNEAYQLSNFVFDLIDNYEAKEELIMRVRETGYELAETYNYQTTKAELRDYFSQKLQSS